MGLFEINERYNNYIVKKDKKDLFLANIFFLSYGSVYDLSDKNLFRFFNSKELLDNKGCDFLVDEDLIFLIKTLFNSSCEKISAIPKLKPELCEKINIVIDKDMCFEAINSSGKCVGAVLVSGVSGYLFEVTEKNAFDKIIYNKISSSASRMSIKIIHGVDRENNLDIKNLGVRQKPYSLKISFLSNNKLYSKKFFTGTMNLCKNIINEKEKSLLIKSFIGRGALINSVTIEPEVLDRLTPSI